jgi:myo-inositol-1(or 4)-monophosphatase
MRAGAPDDALLKKIEETAVYAATEAGKLVAERFGGPMEVMQKGDRAGVDIVTDVDKSSQKLIVEIISKRFPDHMALGEEDPPDPADELPARDFVWAIDPIDGTKNFANGSTIHAVSVGVLYRGEPVAGAMWTPWPSEKGHMLTHARKGGGAWMDGKRLEIKQNGEDPKPQPGRLAAIPGSIGMYEKKKPLRGHMGETRITGSTCFEMLMVATGSMQYALSGFANVWDYASGIVIVREAGGMCMTPTREGWHEITGWGHLFNGDAETSRKMRGWKGAVLSSTPPMAKFLAENLSIRRPNLFQRAWKSVTG